jgi:hypothetical protein
MAKENKPLLRNQKGWRGYVRDFNNYCDAYDDVEWNGTASGSTKKKEVKKGNKTIITFK